MQNYSEVLSYEGYSVEQFSLLVSLAMDSLQWTNQITNDFVVNGETKATAFSWGETVTVKVEPGEAWITSRYRQWTLPLTKKNRKNTEALTEAVISLQHQYTPEQLDELRTKLMAESEHLLADFEKRYESGTLTASEKVALGLGGYYATYTLAAIMIVVFVIMSFSGVSLWAPTVEDIAHWGGNFHPFTTDGEYWRLLSHQFVHIGIIHIALNLYALFSIGVYLEPITGRWRFLLYFLLTGLLAGIFSMWWDTHRVSAGASGSIFGLYGVFLSLLVTGSVGKEMNTGLLSSIGIFIGVNLMYGMKEGIDNAAHIGGLVSGIIGGLLFAGELKWKKAAIWLRTVGIALPLVLATAYLSTPQSKDFNFSLKLQEVAKLDYDADWPISSNNDKSDNQLAGEMERISIPKWTEANGILEHYKPEDLDAFNKKVHALLKHYIQLRLKEANLYIQKADDPSGLSAQELDAVIEQIKAKQEALSELKR